jgi:tyrosinase
MDGDPKNGSVIPKSFKAFLTPESIVELNKTTDIPDAKLKDLEQLLGIRYTSQQAFFTAVKEVLKVEDISSWRNAFIDVLLASNALWYPLRYPAEFFDEGKPSTMENVIGYHYPSADDIRQIQGINNFRDYGGGSRYDNSYGFMDQNPHNTIHIWSGGQNPEWDKETKGILAKGRGYNRHSDLYTQPQYGDMFSNLTASFDPIFWPHHVNIDRLWSEWQRNNPNSNPSDPTAVLTPWNYTVVDTLDASKFGYEYLKSCYRFPVGMGETIPRFTSEPITVPEAALRQHHSVEIRLHQVPQLPLSCYVRAFINQPDANPQTPIHDNPHYAGYLAIFGHGECYGGPGHCDIPPPQAPLFDLREQRLHNNPRNHRIDATACIDKLIEQGASEFQITLVVVGVDGREMRDFLRLESVSLNFTD